MNQIIQFSILKIHEEQILQKILEKKNLSTQDLKNVKKFAAKSDS